MELLHAGNADFIQWFQDVHGCKQKGATAAGRVKDRDVLHGMIEMLYQEMVFCM